MKRHTLIFVGFILLVVLWIIARPHNSADQLQADISAHLPIGTSRQKLDEFLKVRGLDRGIAAFDYPHGDPRQGTLIIGVTPLPEYLRRIRDFVPGIVG